MNRRRAAYARRLEHEALSERTPHREAYPDLSTAGLDRHMVDAMSVACPVCLQAASEPCLTRTGGSAPTMPHIGRVAAARRTS